MTLTAEMIYNAFCVALGSTQPFSTVPQSSRERYEAMARYLNSALQLQHAEVCRENDPHEKPGPSAQSRSWKAAADLANTPNYSWRVPGKEMQS